MAFQASDITEDAAHTVQFSGYSVRESGGTDSVLVEFLEEDATGQVLHSFELEASQPATMFFPEDLVGPVGHADIWVKTTGTGVLTGVIYDRMDR